MDEKRRGKYKQINFKNYAADKFNRLFHIRKSTGEVSDKSEMLSILVDNEERALAELDERRGK